MKSFRLHDAVDHISENAIGKGGKIVPAGTILILVRGMTLHHDVPICVSTRDMAFNQDIKALRPSGDVDSAFLAYWLLANKPTILASVDHAGHGTGRLVTETLKNKPVLLPPLPEQRRIAKILGDIDDKIELNRKMNETLEQMARALFKSWFVDFDPVRAKMEGRTPTGMDAATAALFPDCLVDSELGPIPEGWEVKALGEVMDVVMGQSPPGESYNEVGDGVPFYQGRTDFGVRFPTRRVYCTSPTRFAQPGDTLLSVRAPVGDINIADEYCCIGRGLAALRHRSAAETFTLYSLLSMQNVFSSFEAEGTVFGSINKQNLATLPTVDVPAELLYQFERYVKPIHDLVRNNFHQSRTLSTLRDTLLPKLVGGEVRVGGAYQHTI